MPCAVWMEVAETFASPWSRRLACVDLGVYQSVAIQPTRPIRFPAIGDLATRWGWTAHEVRKLLTDEAAWSDPTLTGNGDRAARWAAIKESRTSRSGSHGSRKDRARIAHGSHEDATVEPVESSTKAHGFNTDHARIAITSLNTRVGSQSTDTEHRAQEKPAPAPAVADLFTPTSQPDAATGEATGDTAPPPSAAAPLPAKAKRDKAAMSPDVAAVWAVYREEQANAGCVRGAVPPKAWGVAARVSDPSIGVDGMIAVIRWAHRSPHDRARNLRDGGYLGETLFRESKAADYLPLARRWLSECGPPVVEPVTTPNTPTAEISEAAAAWASMTFRHEWRLLDRGGVPKRPEDANRDDTPGVVFADEPAEHVRRWHAYRAAGGTKAWREVRGEADRMAFRDAFKAAYELGVISE